MDEQSTLKSCIPDNVEVPKSYRRYLNYKVKKQKANKILVKTPQGLKVLFEISDGTLKKIKQERAVVAPSDNGEKSEQPVSHSQKSKTRSAERQKLSGKIVAVEEKLEQLESSLVGVVSLLEKALPVTSDRTEYARDSGQLEKIEKKMFAFESALADLDKKTRISHETEELRELSEQMRRMEKKILDQESELAGLERPGISQANLEKLLELSGQLQSMESKLDNMESGLARAEKQARAAREDTRGVRGISGQIFQLEQKVDALESGLAAVEKPEPQRSDTLIWQNLSEQLHKLEEKVDNLETGLAAVEKPMRSVQAEKRTVEEITDKTIRMEEKMLQLELKVTNALSEIEEKLRDVETAGAKALKTPMIAPDTKARYKQAAKSLPATLLYWLLFVFRSIARFLKWSVAKGIPAIVSGVQKAVTYLAPKWKLVLPVFFAIVLGTVGLYWSKYYKPRRSLDQELVSEPENEVQEEDETSDNTSEPTRTYQKRDYRAYRDRDENQDDESGYFREERQKQRISQISKWLRLLKNEEASGQDRRDAIGELTKLEARQAGPALIKLLDDPDLKWNAIIALGKIHYQPAASNLAKIAQDPQNSNDIREEAIIALGNIRSRSAINALRNIMNSRAESHLRANAAAALGRIGKTETFRELLAVLHDDDPLVQAEAANALANVDYPAANKEIISLLLTATDIDVRRTAADALGQSTDSRTRAGDRAQALLQVWENRSGDRRLREKAKQSLENLMPRLSPELSAKVRQTLGNR